MEKKEKIVSVVSFVVFLALLFGGSILVYNYFVRSEDAVSDIIFETSDLPIIDGSLATQPLMNAFVADFTQTEISKVNINYSNTHPSYIKLVDGDVDLIVVTEPSEEELAYAKANNVELNVTKVVNEAFVFFVNKNNVVDSLTLDQIQKIYTGEYTNWSSVGGNSAEIIAFQRPENSGSQTGMISLVMNGLKLKKPTSIEYQETMAGIIDVVADYDNGLNSIGYSYYYYAKTMYGNANINLLAVNGIKPSFDTIQSGEYPLMSAYYIVIRSDADEHTLKLKEAMLSNRGQNVAKEAGYVPIK